MPGTLLSADALARARSIRDLTDPAQGAHAMQALLAQLVRHVTTTTGAHPRLERGDPVVSVRDNYDRLRYPPDGVTRDARYSRYVAADRLLRSHTTAAVPGLLDRLAGEPGWVDELLVCPGLVYRRDCVDRLHSGEPHQVDLWRIRRGRRLDRADLEEMIVRVIEAALPGAEQRTSPAVHPYTLAGLQIDVRGEDGWVEIGECGLAHPEVLAGAGLDPSITGLAMGLGLDRLLMLRKRIPDIRLLRAIDPRVRAQMLDLEPYRPVSSMPPIYRDLSIAVAEALSAEELGDQARIALGADAPSMEALEVRAETPLAALPPAAVRRLGAAAGQKNVLLRLVLRDLERTLTDPEANLLRDRVYAAVHQGSAHEWASGWRPAEIT